MEPLGHCAIRFPHLGDLREHGTLPNPLSSFISWTRSLSRLFLFREPLGVLVGCVVLLTDFCVLFCAGFMEFYRLQSLSAFHEFIPCVSISFVGPLLQGLLATVRAASTSAKSDKVNEKPLKTLLMDLSTEPAHLFSRCDPSGRNP